MYMLLDRINAFADLGYALWAFLAKDTPTFEGRSTFHASRLLGSSLQDSVLELCMVFKYVELNRNKSSTSPWSIRQQLLYQNFDTKHNRQSIILLRASEVLKKRIQEVFLQNQGYSPHWTNFIVLTVSTLPTGWAEYAEFLDSATSNVVSQKPIKTRNYSDSEYKLTYPGGIGQGSFIHRPHCTEPRGSRLQNTTSYTDVS